jgi:hypothetical protein
VLPAAHQVGALRQHHSRTLDMLASLGPAVSLLPTRQNPVELCVKWILRSRRGFALSEAHVHIHFGRFTHVATCAERKERTCTCVPTL